MRPGVRWPVMRPRGIHGGGAFLCFFNSLRELGGAASLFVADTRDYLRVILDRLGLKYELIRKLFNVSELTSRIRSDQVPKELERLERTLLPKSSKDNGVAGDDDVVDACLASNIIEVGVDVSRLAIVAILASQRQHRSTSRFPAELAGIQRSLVWWRYSMARASHVIAVTLSDSGPTISACMRRLNRLASLRSVHRRWSDSWNYGRGGATARCSDRCIEPSDPFPLVQGSALLDLIREMIEERVLFVAPEERDEVMKKLQKRLDEWRIWLPREYGGFGPAPQDPPLLHPAGSTEPPSWGGRSWPTMSSLRNVDASCEGEVTSFFNQLQEEQT